MDRGCGGGGYEDGGHAGGGRSGRGCGGGDHLGGGRRCEGQRVEGGGGWNHGYGGYYGGCEGNKRCHFLNGPYQFRSTGFLFLCLGTVLFVLGILENIGVISANRSTGTLLTVVGAVLLIIAFACCLAYADYEPKKNMTTPRISGPRDLGRALTTVVIPASSPGDQTTTIQNNDIATGRPPQYELVMIGNAEDFHSEISTYDIVRYSLPSVSSCGLSLSDAPPTYSSLFSGTSKPATDVRNTNTFAEYPNNKNALTEFGRP